MSQTQQISPTDANLRSEHVDGIIPKDVELLQSYCDADLVKYIQKSPKLPHHNSIFIFSANLIAKSCLFEPLQDTIGAMEVATHLGVRVPAAKRIVTSNGST